MHKVLVTLIFVFSIALSFSFVISVEVAYQHYDTVSKHEQSDRQNQTSSNCKKEGFWATFFSDPTAFFTGVLALFTMVLAGATVYLLLVTKSGIDEQAGLTREAVAHANTSATAASLQAKATLSAELPRPVINNVELLETGVSNLKGRLQAHKIHVEIKNYGRSPAFLNRQCIDLIVCGRLPPIPPHKNVITLDTGTVIDRQGLFSLDRPRLVNGDILMEMADIDHVIAGTKMLYMFGFIEYRDFLNDLHIFRFCKCLVTPRVPSNLRWYDGPFEIPRFYLVSE